MTLSQISDASQAVAAVAVVASLVILILQNHQANILARDEARRRQMESIQNISRPLFESPGLADVWGRGASDFEELSSEDRIKFIAYLTYTHRLWEAMHQDHLSGKLDNDVWRSHAEMFRAVQALKGVKQGWAIRKHVFSAAFQAFYTANASHGVVTDIYGLRPSKEERPVARPA